MLATGTPLSQVILGGWFLWARLVWARIVAMGGWVGASTEQCSDQAQGTTTADGKGWSGMARLHVVAVGMDRFGKAQHVKVSQEPLPIVSSRCKAPSRRVW